MYADDENAPAAEEPQEAVPEQPVAEATAETEGAQAAPETPAEGTEAKAEEPISDTRLGRRVAHLTRIASDTQRERDDLKRRLDEAQALLQQGQSAEVNAEIERLRLEVYALRQGTSQQDFIEKRQAIIDAGVKEFTDKVWNDRTEYLTLMGAVGRPDFMEALVDIPQGHKLAVHLADNPNLLKSLLDKRPSAMAAHMGLIAAELAVADAPKPKELSNAPRPVKPVGAGRVEPPFKVPDAGTPAWFEWRNQTAPKRLGGQGKTA